MCRHWVTKLVGILLGIIFCILWGLLPGGFYVFSDVIFGFISSVLFGVVLGAAFWLILRIRQGLVWHAIFGLFPALAREAQKMCDFEGAYTAR